jgi:uncharacterized protein YecE (DUF72 family)
MTAKIYIGTSSFADKTVIPYFYPDDLSPSERITFYSMHFNTVEIDSSFYALPSERNSVLFSNRTPADFVFHFKAFRLMTLHPTPVSSLGRTLRSYLPKDFYGDKLTGFPNEEMMNLCFRMFSSSLLPLKYAGKLGYILFQFPPWFKKKDENINYLRKVRELLPESKIAVEFRNGTWFLENEKEDTLKILKELGFTHTIVDEPQIGIYGSVPTVLAITTRDSYIRFHGRNSETWKKKGVSVQEKFRYLYSKEELEPWVEDVKSLSREVENIYIFFNNCFAYYALKNARMFADMLDILKDKMPLRIRGINEGDAPQLF